MRMLIKIICTLLVFTVLFAAAPIQSLIEIDWWSVGPGSQTLSNGNIALTGMVGQAVSFEVGEGDYDMYSGYLYLPFELLMLLYLPVILK